MAIKTVNRSATRIERSGMPASYFALVRRFPLTPIRDDDHLAEALRVIDDLLRSGTEETVGPAEYLAVLTSLVEAHEGERYPIPDAPPPDRLRELMRANQINQEQLGREVGIAQSTISAVLNGTRRLTIKQAAALGKRFHLPPVTFLES